MDQQASFTVVARGSAPIITLDLSGSLTGTAQPALDDAYAAATAAAARGILLNFGAVDYVNSAGVAVLIELMSKSRKADQHLAITGLTPHYQKVFHFMGLSHFAHIYATEADACAALARSGSTS